MNRFIGSEMKSIEKRTIARLKKNPPDEQERNALFVEAAMTGWPEVVKVLLEMGADPNFDEISSRPVLALASLWGRDHADVVDVLLKAGADPNGPKVMEYCGLESLPLLIEAGGLIDGSPGATSTPLITAISERTKEDKALALIAAGADVNRCDSEGKTPIMHAITFGRSKVFDALLEAGAGLLDVDNSGRSVLRLGLETLSRGTMATTSDRKKTQKLVRQIRDNLPAQPEDLVLVDIVLGDSESLKRRLKQGLDANTFIAGNIGMAGFSIGNLLDRLGSVINENGSFLPSTSDMDKQSGGTTLLMWAVAGRQPECVKALLQAGADPNLRNADGVSAALLSTRINDPGIRHLLGTSDVKPGITHAIHSEKDLKKRDFTPDLSVLSDSESRAMRLGIVEREAERSLDRYKNEIKERSEESRMSAFYIEDYWEVVSILHILEQPDDITGYLTHTIRCTEEFLFGDWRKEIPSHEKSKLPPDLYWRKKLEWVQPFVRGIAAAALLKQWETIERFFKYPDKDCQRGERDPSYNLEWFDWPFWIMVARSARGERPGNHYRKSIKGETGKRAQLLLDLCDLIEEGNEKEFSRAMGKLITVHRSHVIRKNEAPSAERILSPEACFMLPWAQYHGMKIEPQEKWHDFILIEATR